MKKFFDYIQLPNFDIAADAAATFKVKRSWSWFRNNASPSLSPLIKLGEKAESEAFLLF